MLFHSGLSPSASWRTVSTIRYMMFSSTLQKPGHLNTRDWEQSWKHCQHPGLREKLEQARTHPEFMYLLHTSAQALGEEVSASPNRKKKSAFPNFTAFTSSICPIPAVQAEHNRYPWKLSEVGQLWDPFPVPVSISQSSQKTLVLPFPLHT